MNIDGLKHLKESKVRDSAGVEGDDDLNPMVEVFRAGVLVALIVAPHVDRDQGLHACRIAAVGFSADKISMVMDAHMASAPVNPKTGKEWGPGEMQRACHEDGACAVGLITDCLLVMDAYRTGRIVQSTLPYHVHAEAKTVRWVVDEHVGTLDTDTPNNELQGIVPDAVRDAFTKPQIIDSMRAELGLGVEHFGLTEEQARIHCDCAMAKLLGSEDYQVALVPATDEAAEIIARSMDSDEAVNR